jgi:HAE1 family hydrophobic/amphiphilic exporter-1
MKLPELGVNRPVTTLMIFTAILILGLVSISRLAVDMLPEMEPPAISVITLYPGASAEDVETKVTKYIEDEVSIVSNLDKIRSVSKQDISIVTAEFEWGTDLNEASNDIRDKLELAKRKLPDDIEEPLIFKFNTSVMPILFFGISAGESYFRLYHIVDKQIADPLKRIPGVGAVKILGGLERQIQVRLDSNRLRAYNLSPQQISARLSAENVTLPAGSVKTGSMEYSIRVLGEFQSPEEIGEIVVGQHQGSLIYLKDVAQVEDSFKEKMVFARADRKEGLRLMIQKQSGANTVEVIRRVKQALEKIKRRLPPDISIVTQLDSSEFIERSIRNLSQTIYWGGFFVILVVFFFLRRVRSSLIIALSLPFSLIIAFIFMFAFGFTINMMSLTSLAIAIGMVVDNSIVVLENITRHLEAGERPGEAALFGTNEVGLAISASTLTTIAIFLPLVFVRGITGVMFKQLGLITSMTLLASLFTALNFTPMLCSKLLKPEMFLKREPSGNKRGFYQWSENLFAGLDKLYAGLLGGALSRRKTTLSICGGIFVLSLLLLPRIGTEFIPEEDTGDLVITIQLTPGTKMEETERVAREIEEIFLENVPEMEALYAQGGQSEEGIASTLGMKEGPNVLRIGAKLVKQKLRRRSTKEIAQVLRKRIEQIPGIVKMDVDAGNPIAGLLFGGAKPITVEIIGHSLKSTDALAAQIKKIVQETPGAVDVKISRDISKPEYRVLVDRRKASSLGVTMQAVADTLRAEFYGKKSTPYREAGEEYDVFLRLRPDERSSLADIANVSIPALDGRQIRLANIAQIVQDYGPLEIERQDQERIVKVEAGIYGRALGDVAADIKHRMAGLHIPPGITVDFGGDVEEQREAFQDLALLLALGSLLVYMVMASQFESLIDPFIIMFSIPFAFTGVALFLYLTGTTLSIMSFIGLIILVGIVVNNAIVLIDYINILRARGQDMLSAVKNAGASRLRPVLMTTITTIFGMLPLAISTGEGAEIWRPLGISVIGGLTVSTLVTLVIVPVLYSIFEQHVKTRQGLKPLHRRH